MSKFNTTITTQICILRSEGNHMKGIADFSEFMNRFQVIKEF